MTAKNDRRLAASVIVLVLLVFGFLWYWPPSWLDRPTGRPATKWVPGKSTACAMPKPVDIWLGTWDGATA